MIEMNKFLEVLNLLELNYNKMLPKEIIEIWYEVFKDFQLEEFKAMIIESIKEYPFFPTINQVCSKQETPLKKVDEGAFQL